HVQGSASVVINHSSSAMADILGTISCRVNHVDIWHVILPLAVIIRYGYYGDSRMVLGPSSSRLVKANSIFVQQVEVKDEGSRKGVLLYEFSEKPELNFETNWSISNYMTATSYSRKGFSLWLNKGSRIHMRWEAQTSSLNQLQVVIIKGEREYKTLLPDSWDALNLSETVNGKEAEYRIEEDDRYYLGLINTNSESITMTLSVNVTSKMYDLSRATNVCSTIKGSCRFKLLFPRAQYLVVTTPNNGDASAWFIELSFVARVITYIAILVCIIIFVFLVMKYLGRCDTNNNMSGTTVPWEAPQESAPLMADKSMCFSYRTNEEDEEDGSSISSSEELYNAKLCAICYDDQRNCFFVPCGHCATCYECAQRIVEGDNKVCPICRRLVHKVRRLFNP
ncbi:hypothetical protein Tsubulata_037157, partial [Turnera subulata]